MTALPQLAGYTYLIGAVFGIFGVRLVPGTASKWRVTGVYLLLGVLCLGVHYLCCDWIASTIREAGHYWVGVALMLGINYLMLDLLYGWWLSRRIAGKRDDPGVAIFQEGKQKKRTKDPGGGP